MPNLRPRLRLPESESEVLTSSSVVEPNCRLICMLNFDQHWAGRYYNHVVLWIRTSEFRVLLSHKSALFVNPLQLKAIVFATRGLLFGEGSLSFSAF